MSGGGEPLPGDASVVQQTIGADGHRSVGPIRLPAVGVESFRRRFNEIYHPIGLRIVDDAASDVPPGGRGQSHRR